jgi:hypothetical protein
VPPTAALTRNRRLQEGNALFGLPIVLDTNSEDFKVGQKARPGAESGGVVRR